LTIVQAWIDTCPCVILYDDSAFTFVSWEKRCNEHRLLDGQPLFDAIVAHSNSFNRQFSSAALATKAEFQAEQLRINLLKATEKDRITKAGPTERK